MSTRPQINRKDLANGMRSVWRSVWKESLVRAKEKRTPEINSSHEVLGMMQELNTKFANSVFTGAPKETQQKCLEEIGFVLILAAASIKAGGTDW